MLDVAMSKISLQRPRIMSGISQRKAAGMARHVWMRLEIEAGGGAGPLDHLGEAGSRERRAALAYKHER
jgi:hypothetical protein